jgi:membrane protease YdiL (CAAX protease family)
MLGVIVILIVSAVILYFFQQKSIAVLGFRPPLKRLGQFLIGFLLMAIMCTAMRYIESMKESFSWNVNHKILISTIADMVWWDFISVLTEELTYRGALLYILIMRFGSRIGIGVSAISFGIYHWFSFGVIGNPMAMLFVFLGTGLMGLAWAYAFDRTRSIFMPLGFHFGWNVTYNTIFSKGPQGQGLLTSSIGNHNGSSLFLIEFLVLPVLLFFVIKYFVPAMPGVADGR